MPELLPSLPSNFIAHTIYAILHSSQTFILLFYALYCNPHCTFLLHPTSYIPLYIRPTCSTTAWWITSHPNLWVLFLQYLSSDYVRIYMVNSSFVSHPTPRMSNSLYDIRLIPELITDDLMLVFQRGTGLYSVYLLFSVNFILSESSFH